MTPTSQFLVSYGELVVFLIVFVEQNGVPFPAAPFLLASGALAADGYINLFAAILCTTVGSVAADSIWFYTGHRTKTLQLADSQGHPLQRRSRPENCQMKPKPIMFHVR